MTSKQPTPADFIDKVIRNTEKGEPFKLSPYQRKVLDLAFRRVFPIASKFEARRRLAPLAGSTNDGSRLAVDYQAWQRRKRSKAGQESRTVHSTQPRPKNSLTIV